MAAKKKAAKKKPAAKRKPAAKKKPAAKPAKKAAKAKPKKAAAAVKTVVAKRKEVVEEPEQHTLESVLAAIDAAEEAPLSERLSKLDALESLLYVLEDDDEQEQVQSALESAQQGCIDFAHTDAEARAGLLATVREDPYRGDRIEALAKIPDDETFQFVREHALEEIDKSYDDTNTRWLFALGAFAKHAQYADEVRAIVLGGFDRIIDKARKTGDLANAVAYGGLAFAAINIAHPDTGPALHKALRIACDMEDFDAHYNLNQSAGAIATAIALIDYTAARDDIQAFVGDKGDAHGDEEFVMQGAYALYMLDRDGAGALESLRAGNDASKNLGYLAAAIADLDFKEGKGELFDRVRRRGHAVSKAAFAEALHRLDKQDGPPAVPARMIWMFGRTSPVERALGHETDNIFRQRAEARQG